MWVIARVAIYMPMPHAVSIRCRPLPCSPINMYSCTNWLMCLSICYRAVLLGPYYSECDMVFSSSKPLTWTPTRPLCCQWELFTRQYVCQRCEARMIWSKSVDIFDRPTTQYESREGRFGDGTRSQSIKVCATMRTLWGKYTSLPSTTVTAGDVHVSCVHSEYRCRTYLGAQPRAQHACRWKEAPCELCRPRQPTRFTAMWATRLLAVRGDCGKLAPNSWRTCECRWRVLSLGPRSLLD